MTRYGPETVIQWGKMHKNEGCCIEQHHPDKRWYICSFSWSRSTLENRIGPYESEADAESALKTLITLNEVPVWRPYDET